METLKKLGAAPDWTSVASAFDVLERELGRFDLSFSPANATKMAKRVDALVAATNDPEAPASLLRLLDVLSEWLTTYEDAHTPIPALDPIDFLQHLMEANDLRQRDIADILGGQSVVSSILRRRRKINARQALALGRRFKVSPAAFLEGAEDDEDADVLSGPTPTAVPEQVSFGSCIQLVDWQNTSFTGVLQ